MSLPSVQLREEQNSNQYGSRDTMTYEFEMPSDEEKRFPAEIYLLNCTGNWRNLKKERNWYF